MQNIFELSNSTGGVPAACLSKPERAADTTKHWECMFAQNAVATIKAPTFVINSALDMWQTWCVFTAEPVAGFPNQVGTNNGNCSAAPGWNACSQDPENCTSHQMAKMNTYITDFTAVVKNVLAPVGHGAFIQSCHEHCMGISGGYNNYRIGNISLQDAVSAWWNAPPGQPTASHTHWPCQYHTTSFPHQCNPTC